MSLNNKIREKMERAKKQEIAQKNINSFFENSVTNFHSFNDFPNMYCPNTLFVSSEQYAYFLSTLSVELASKFVSKRLSSRCLTAVYLFLEHELVDDTDEYSDEEYSELYECFIVDGDKRYNVNTEEYYDYWRSVGVTFPDQQKIGRFGKTMEIYDA